MKDDKTLPVNPTTIHTTDGGHITVIAASDDDAALHGDSVRLHVVVDSEAIKVFADNEDSAGRIGCVWQKNISDMAFDPDEDPCAVHPDEDEAVDEDYDPTANLPAVRVEVRDWTASGGGFQHRIVAYGMEGSWQPYSGHSTVLAEDRQTYMSFMLGQVPKVAVIPASVNVYNAPEPKSEATSLRIMLVEDEKGIRNMLSYTLGRRLPGCVVDSFDGSDPDAVRDSLLQVKYDVLITDNRAHKINGMDLVAWAMRIRWLPPTTIVMSGTFSVAETEALKRMAQVAYTEHKRIHILDKPFERARLLDLIKDPMPVE